MTRLQKLQKKAPKALKSLDAKLKSPPETQGELVGGGIVRDRKAASGDKRFGVTVWEACNPLKSHKTAKAFFGKAWTKTA
jgi:hypothetical protein